MVTQMESGDLTRISQSLHNRDYNNYGRYSQVGVSILVGYDL